MRSTVLPDNGGEKLILQLSMFLLEDVRDFSCKVRANELMSFDCFNRAGAAVTAAELPGTCRAQQGWRSPHGIPRTGLSETNGSSIGFA